MNSAILGIAGYMGSGKNTVARILHELRGDVVEIAFADPMKDFVSLVYDWPRELLNDLRFKNMPDPRYNGLTPRHALQQLGTEWGRGCYVNTWADLGIRRALVADGLAVITDVRFPNEVKAIHRAGGKVVLVYRADPPELLHSSESFIDSLEYDYELSNTGTLYELQEQIEALMPELMAR